jgi:Tfp pilus assembly protein PilX
MKPVGRLTKDETGVALPLAVIMIVLIAVMGAGLLTFVATDLTAVASVNQGQRALELADAGVQAAKRQLISDANRTTNYDGSGQVSDNTESQWSYKTNGTSNGVVLNNLDASLATSDSVSVTIQGTITSISSFRIVSTGQYEDAKRRIEAVYKVTPGISNSIPAAHFTWSDIDQAGGGGDCNLDGVSMFAMGNAEFSGSFDICSTPDQAYGRWAATNGTGPYPNTAGSYPNPYNLTPRSDSVAGIGARGTISAIGGAASEIAEGTRSFDRDTTPTKVVADYAASPLPNNQKIAFPFGVASSPPASDLEVLRERALELERQNPGIRYYIDSNPGNGVNDAGLTSDHNIGTVSTLTTTPWPAGSNYQTVVFFEFATSGRTANWNITSACSPTDTRKGVIAVENGNFNIGNNNGGFNGTVVIRGGAFFSGGGSCITGYVNTDGDINMSGGFAAGSVPPLTSLPEFQSGSTELLSWRELYE